MLVCFPELELSGLAFACDRSCVRFEFSETFTVNSWKGTSFVLVGSCVVVRQCLVVDW